MSAQNGKKNPQPKDKKKLIIIGVICVILLLNIMWTVLQSKFTPKLDGVKADMAKLEQRLAKLEQGGLPDVADLKEDFASLKEVSTKLSERLAQTLKTEEEQLKYLESLVEAQKARIESLKKLTAE